MLKKSLLSLSLVILVMSFWMPDNTYAWSISFHSLVCTEDVKGGTNLNNNEQAFLCALNLKEVATKCVNKGGNADESNSHIFEIQGTLIRITTAQGAIKQKNGTTPLSVTFNDEDVELIVAEYNSLNPDKAVDLSNLCPNKNFTLKLGIARADVQMLTVLRPKNGKSEFSCTPTVFNLGDPWGTVTECIPNKEPFRSCEREISGLHFQDANGSEVTDTKVAFIQNCRLFRDVNKDPAFDLNTLVDGSTAVYNPDEAHIFPPFNGGVDATGNPCKRDGTDPTCDAGGIWLTNNVFVDGNFYTATCHQHGNEKGGSFKQSGPLKPDYDVVTGKAVPGTGDVECTGGSQLLDGVYGDGIFP